MKTSFGEMTFNIGWKTKATITWFGKKKDVIVKAKAYFEKDGITSEQTKSMKSFVDSNSDIIEKLMLLAKEKDSDACNRFIPKTLLFNRDGSSALLCDDRNEPDEGIAICIDPELKIMLQDDYL